ncbi:MAG: DUF1549 and DUF1553 domain-containing protein [Pirellulaceae bacterium]|nr:DUF1549 and DUF1553 domain-containing protein [Pirellulaceae bacterium]
MLNLRAIASALVAVACLVNSSHSEQPLSFELDVQPILTSTGCNAGACHGKQRGQNGFQLSLLGFDADFDFDQITQQGRGRRLFPASPEKSLLLQKATAELPHGGGQRFAIGSEAYNVLLKWIQQGAQRSLPGEAKLESVELAQTDFTMRPGESLRLKVTAKYSDGSVRDVTEVTSYLANEAVVVAVDAQGVMQAGSLPGETAIMARYMNHICVANIVIPQSRSLAADYFAQLPRRNFIDDLVYAKLQKTATEPSAPIDDATFMRRVYTDLIGRLPSVSEAKEFLDTQSENKREYLVDQLLERPEYVDHWANQWADLLRPNPYRVGIKAVLNYDNWIRQQFRDNVPYDQFARKLIEAKGSTWQNGAATLYRDRREPEEIATLISQLFMGVRLECAKCHHHPFEKWSQRDFYQFAAYFAKVDRKGTGLSPPISGGEEVILVSTKGAVKHPVTSEVLKPHTLFGETPEIEEGAEPRTSLADWMTSKGNDYFAKVQVNRVWAALMGRGLVEPVDDIRSTNPPTNPELFDALAKHFQDNNYDLKNLLKTITLSNVYSISSIPNETNVSDRLNYSRHYRHQLRAEVLLDAVADITETPNSLDGMWPGARANQVWTHRVSSMFLDTFGRPNENQDPPCERTPGSTVTQALHLMNSPEIDRRIRSDEGRIARLAKSNMSATEIVNELYLAVFSRYPSDEERTYATDLLTAAGDKRRGAIEDLMWAMLNAPECSIQN